MIRDPRALNDGALQRPEKPRMTTCPATATHIGCPTHPDRSSGQVHSIPHEDQHLAAATGHGRLLGWPHSD